MDETDIYWTFIVAQHFGGSFFRDLAKAGMKADPVNKRRILDAFPEMVSTYGPASQFHKLLRVNAQL